MKSGLETVSSKAFEIYVGEIAKCPPMSREDEYKIAKRFKETSSLQDRELLIKANLRLVIAIAFTYANTGASILDLIQEGSIGLMRAIKKFDPDLGFRLSTYAQYWIRDFIEAFLRKNFRLMKMPTGDLDVMILRRLRSGKLAPLLSLLANGQDVDASEEISPADQAAGITVEALMSKRGMAQRELSLDDHASHGDGDEKESFGDGISDGVDNEAALAEVLDNNALREQIGVLLDGLTDLENYILMQRILSEDPMTLQAIGDLDEFQLTRERVRQVEAKVREKIARQLRRSGTSEEFAAL
ncbi:MAG: RNA polymerase sigma-32 subunit RpoH, RNA polymerase sigma-32 factor [Candidatus Peregrinibacteria bacterium GW2011_GWC2_39_14]|nr:MAG: RNA polymerase sigma factor [Candidatus Peregrinibacteria bacterium GW2011_GWA2_38_36]KKR07154.1 MAG: RNA polymerase sigma-32 subunit RpoH, RNA polymerase sigma-32 factor [Candidatus Peregrinibacteria bacterium GW2011_GWC2_39_14]